jgi:DNA invertase Pin-like site-specific DNA recombinase
MKAARRGAFDTVLVLRLDRAFRSVRDTADTMDTLQHYHVGFISITQNFDTTSSMGKLMLNLLAAFAEFERDILRERTREGMARAAAQGKHLGRPKGSTDKKKRQRSGYYARWARYC